MAPRKSPEAPRGGSRRRGSPTSPPHPTPRRGGRPVRSVSRRFDPPRPSPRRSRRSAVQSVVPLISSPPRGPKPIMRVMMRVMMRPPHPPPRHGRGGAPGGHRKASLRREESGPPPGGALPERNCIESLVWPRGFPIFSSARRGGGLPSIFPSNGHCSRLWRCGPGFIYARTPPSPMAPPPAPPPRASVWPLLDIVQVDRSRGPGHRAELGLRVSEGARPPLS